MQSSLANRRFALGVASDHNPRPRVKSSSGPTKTADLCEESVRGWFGIQCLALPSSCQRRACVARFFAVASEPAAIGWFSGAERTLAVESSQIGRMTQDAATFEDIVSSYYESLYRFAFSLTQREADARDLTQETFSQFAKKGHQLRDKSKAKSWLFTTLYRAFVDSRRWHQRYRHVEVDEADHELTPSLPDAAERIDAATARAALMHLDEVYRAPLVLFYLQEHSYQEIADTLGIPIGTVMSRLSRGKALLRQLMEDGSDAVVPLTTLKAQTAS
jgi:RNA polymerase sigma-70 factor (ECF subfamily)